MKIKLEQRHIDQGIPLNSGKCPYALAISEQVAQCDVGWAAREIPYGIDTRQYKGDMYAFFLDGRKVVLPRFISLDIIDYDLSFGDKKIFKPCDFELEVT